MAALAPRLSRLALTVPDQARVPGLELLRDGARLTEAVWGVATAVDPGKHLLEARAPGRLPWRQEATITTEGVTESVAVPTLTKSSSSPPPPVNGATSPHARPSKALESQRIAALAVGGLGIVGVGVAGYFGLSAQASFSESKSKCNSSDYCTTQGMELRSTAKTEALVATAATSIGAAALVTAAILWFTVPRGETTTAQAQPWALAPGAGTWGLGVARAF